LRRMPQRAQGIPRTLSGHAVLALMMFTLVGRFLFYRKGGVSPPNDMKMFN
jgi:hypothetical protein